MQMVKKIALVFATVWFAIVLFMPKEALYFKLEQVLEKQGIKINEGSIDEGLFSLTLHDVAVYAHGIRILKIKKATLWTLLFYNRLTLDSIATDKGLDAIISFSADRAAGLYALYDPVHISLRASGGTAGTLTGTISLKERRIYIVFDKQKEWGTLKRFLKKDNNGWYYAF